MKIVGGTIKHMKLALSIICLFLVACPPPAYDLEFSLDGLKLDRVIIQEREHFIKIAGFHEPHLSASDRIWIQASFSNKDTLSPGLCREIIDIQSNNYWDYHPNLLKGGQTCAFDLHHEWRNPITFDEYISFLDTTYIRITIQLVPEKSYVFYVNFNKEWIRKRFEQYSNKEEKKRK